MTKSAALVGASEFNFEYFKVLYDEGDIDFLIAVDGGYAYLDQMGIVPDMVLGDFDSLGYVPTGIRTVRFSPEKDNSDMELALRRAKQKKCSNVFAFGALGRRLDHTIANLQVFSKFASEGLSITAIGSAETVTFLNGPDILEIGARDLGTVSVFSLSDISKGVFERGLKWELDDVELSNRTSLGLSNEFIGEPVMIGVEEGSVAVVISLPPME